MAVAGAEEASGRRMNTSGSRGSIVHVAEGYDVGRDEIYAEATMLPPASNSRSNSHSHPHSQPASFPLQSRSHSRSYSLTHSQSRSQEHSHPHSQNYALSHSVVRVLPFDNYVGGARVSDSQSFMATQTHSQTNSKAPSAPAALGGGPHQPVLPRTAAQDDAEGSLAALAQVASDTRSASTSQRRSRPPAAVLVDSSSPPPPSKRSKMGKKRHSSTRGPTIVWYLGHDMRVSDHPALQAAANRGEPIVPVFLWSPDEWSPGAAGRWWLENSIRSLTEDLGALGLNLVVRRTKNYGDGLRQIIRETKADAVFWNRQYDPALLAICKKLQLELSGHSISCMTFKSELLVEPWELQDADGRDYKSLSAYVQAWMALPPPPPPTGPPKRLVVFPTKLPSAALDELGLVTSDKLRKNLANNWRTGSKAAVETLERFLSEVFPTYGDFRCRRDLEGTSKLSPYLRFGEISPRTVYHSVRQETAKLLSGRRPEPDKSNRQNAFYEASRAFLKNLCLRDFAHHVLFNNPNMETVPILPEYASFPWSDDTVALGRWRSGRTGYPMVDAAMHQLAEVGWLHNSLRYLLACFVTKFLLLPWHLGLKEFKELMVDGDVALNALGWQWSFGSNLDSFPVDSLVNPVAVGQKQDPTGYYVRYWLPELRFMPNNFIHSPWTAPREMLREAGVVLGDNYPAPIIELVQATQRAVDAVRAMKPRLGSFEAPGGAKPGKYLERAQDWPEGELEQLDVEDEQITRNSLGLLPSLWQMVHYDPSPLDLSQSWRLNSSIRTTGKKGSSSPSGTTHHSHRNRPAGSSGGGSDSNFARSHPYAPSYNTSFPKMVSGNPSPGGIEVQVPYGAVVGKPIAAGGTFSAPPSLQLSASPSAHTSAPTSTLGASPPGTHREPSWADQDGPSRKQHHSHQPSAAKRARPASSLNASRSTSPTKHQRNSSEVHGKGPGKSAAEQVPADASRMTLDERQVVLKKVVDDSQGEYQSLASFIHETYELTDNVDRLTSKDYVRLCTIKADYHRACGETDQSKVKIYKMKTFFSKILQLEVTGEWDRHKQGGVRGPYVYGIRTRPKTTSSS